MGFVDSGASRVHNGTIAVHNVDDWVDIGCGYSFGNGGEARIRGTRHRAWSRDPLSLQVGP